MDGIATSDHLVWRQRLAERTPGHPIHVYFKAEEARAFLHTLIATTTFDEEHAVTAESKPAELQVVEPSDDNQEDDMSIEANANKVIDGFPCEAYEAFSTLSNPERMAIRQDLRSVLLPIDANNRLEDYIPIQILFQIVEAATDNDLFPISSMREPRKYLYQAGIMENYLEWILETNISDFSTVYTLCLELTTILNTPELLKVFKKTLAEHRQVVIETWNRMQRVTKPTQSSSRTQKTFGNN